MAKRLIFSSEFFYKKDKDIYSVKGIDIEHAIHKRGGIIVPIKDKIYIDIFDDNDTPRLKNFLYIYDLQPLEEINII